MRSFPLKWVLALIAAPTLLLTACTSGSHGSDEDTRPTPSASATPTDSTTIVTEPSGAPKSPSQSPDPLPTPLATSLEPSVVPAPSPTPTPVLPAGCDAPNGLSQPDALQVGSLDTRAVVRLPRVDDLSPEPPNFAKDIYAWDNQGGEIGDDAYKAYFTAHTYSSDSSALGNQLIDHAHEGDLARVTNIEGSIICYQVTERVEVLESEYLEMVRSRPSQGVLVITVCSGLEGRNWTKRTVWFAQLVEPA